MQKTVSVLGLCRVLEPSGPMISNMSLVVFLCRKLIHSFSGSTKFSLKFLLSTNAGRTRSTPGLVIYTLFGKDDVKSFYS